MSLSAHTIKQGTSSGLTTTAVDTTGCKLIVLLYVQQNNNLTPTDSAGNTWTPGTARFPPGQLESLKAWYCINPTVSSSHTFTSPSSGGSFPTMAVLGFTDNVTAFDVENGAGGNSATSLATGSTTPSQDGEIVIAGNQINVTGAQSVNVGSILDQVAFLTSTSYGLASWYEIQTTATARNVTFSWSTGASASAAIASFKVAAPSGKLRLNANLDGLSASGGFFANRLAA